eukprot:CAMPEP_0175042062 /NCGR_PEP_ID=MMETSP0052_2-20121109/2321_1 /TAXON_ID=51329 ORGANISM="Polytomella parva, Strain SAG 63-3" /NCGR_SAMPLE_ID=MMETSP0052_2 /ASSEMBLY_ACC=CAM_ASM_000194 /LENGTH=385 /DNA_ID=CAMNT_0016304765 /DNA_START=93 /DNA_END=1250 /DNA_ORIENTATION=-
MPISEYQKEYWEKAVPHPHSAIRPLVNPIWAKAPFDGNTSYVETYKPWAIAPPRSCRPIQVPGEPQSFQSHTTYRTEFPAKGVPYLRVKPTIHLATTNGPFVSETTNATDFPNWGPISRPPAVVRATSVPRNPGAFDGTATYRSDFPKWPVQRPASTGRQRHASNAFMSSKDGGDKFDDGTVYKTTFTPKDFIPVVVKKPTDDKSFTNPETTQWYDGQPTTEYGTSFHGNAGARPAALFTPGKPRSSTASSMPAGPFDPTTTYGVNYIRPITAPVPIRSIRPVNSSIGNGGSRGPFYDDTTYRSQFFPKETSYKRVKPVFEPSTTTTGPFEDETTHRTAYRPWEGAGPVTRVATSSTKRGSLGASNQPFDGITTYRADFVKMVRA